MEKLTHIAFSNTIALSVIRPDSFGKLALTIGFATLGGVISDVDLKNSDIDKIFDKLMIVLCSILITALVFNFSFDLNLLDKVKNINHDIRPYISVIFFIIFAFIGSKTPHRSFTHSFIGIFLYSYIIHLGFSNICVYPFIIGMLTHVFLDLFNKTGITYFYPIKKRFSLDLCDSHGYVNHLIFLFSSLVNVIIIGVLVLSIIFKF